MCPKKIYKDMLKFVAKFEKQYKDNDPEKKFRGNYTGDTFNNYKIHQLKEFSWLNKKIKQHTLEYLKRVGTDFESIKLHCQKSWPVVCSEDGGGISPHIHVGSHLTAVYYLRTNPENGGSLIFDSGQNHFLSSIPIRIKDVEDFSFNSRQISFDTNPFDLIIFPSNIFHYVDEYISENSRYSITYDLMITSNEDIDCENLLLHPKNWLEL